MICTLYLYSLRNFDWICKAYEQNMPMLLSKCKAWLLRRFAGPKRWRKSCKRYALAGLNSRRIKKSLNFIVKWIRSFLFVSSLRWAKSAPIGLIISPNYPNDYPHNLDCEWVISIMTQRKILLNITDLQFEGGANCENNDYLEIRYVIYILVPECWMVWSLFGSAWTILNY